MNFRCHLLFRLAAPVVLALAAGAAPLHAEDVSPFIVTPTWGTNNGVWGLKLAFTVPAKHHLYADEFYFELAGQRVSFTLPSPDRVKDKFSGDSKLMFQEDFVATRPVRAPFAGDAELVVKLHGCSEEECYFPETRRWIIHPDQTIVRVQEPTEVASAPGDAGALTRGFKVTNRASGYLSSRDLIRFLEEKDGEWTGGLGAFSGFGIVATIGLILLGGLALNLTPCVLPMIPINLAILSAGTRSGDKRRGFVLGIAYGSGMALAYGGLGLAVVLTGSKFGALNSSAWFNFVIAGVFVVLGLAMFDMLAIDFSRFQRVSPKQSNRSAFIGATLMGVFSALLAGACVAPVVISVLLLATTSFQQGNSLGLLFPFLLGLGMALPWPFAAAGLSFLPKPGQWMTQVKYGFGVIIFAFAAWYGWLGWSLAGFGKDSSQTAADAAKGVQELRAALETSRNTGRPVFVDFWASWCKNCEAMEHTTFRDPAVRDRLGQFVVVKFRAQNVNDATTKPVLDELGVVGLPTYVLLRPENLKAPDAQSAALSK